MSLCVMCNKELTWIKGFEEEYIITSNGKIFCSIDNKRMLKSTPTIKKTKVDKYGYERVMLYKHGKSKLKQVHRLVAEAFIDNPDNLPQVNHKDENKLNNSVDNLEWCDAKYNCNYGTRTERKAKSRQIPILQYTLDGEFVREWESAKQAEREGGFSAVHICNVLKGKRPHHKNFKWIYK